MSNVRISNGSPTLERMEARQADYPKPSACRNLFGPVDHEELARELRKHSRDLEEASRRRWNFDFHVHQPLEGRYEWQALDNDALPEFYSRPPRLSQALAKRCSHHHHQHQHHHQQQQHLGGLDVHANCPTAGHGRSQGISEEEEEEEKKKGGGGGDDNNTAAAPKTEAAGAQVDLAGHGPGQRKRPAPDDSFPRNKRANTTEEAILEDSPSASSVEQTPKKSSPRRNQT